MGRPKSENTKKIVLTLPEEIALKMKFFVEIQGEARTNSDLVIKLVNDLVANRLETLKAGDLWEKFMKRIESKKEDKLDALFGESSSDEEEDEEEEEK